MRGRRRIRLPLLILSAILGSALAAGAAGVERKEIGKAFFEQGDVPGLLDPLARSIESGEIFRAVSWPAILHFDNGEVLKFAANTSAIFEGAADGTVKVTVLSGQVSKLGEGERVLWAGSGSVFTLEPSWRDPLEVEQILLRPDDRSAAGGRPLSPRELERAADRARP